jgi:hypothetical protein
MEEYLPPPLYAPWVNQLLGGPIPNEERATCQSCAMCTPIGIAAPSDVSFNPATKCCAYTPSIPNFLAGAILLDQSHDFAHNREIFIAAALKNIVTPLGISPPKSVQFLYKIKDFGKQEYLLCPFYVFTEGGFCGIWQYRNSQCFTWFCKFNRGVMSLRFWEQLRSLLSTIEKSLAQWCVDRIGVEIPENPRNEREAVWGNWAEREGEFFIECSRLVASLSWNEALSTAGEEGHKLAQLTVAAYQDMLYESVPYRLKSNSVKCESLGNRLWRVWAYSPYDPIDLSESVLEVINYFDGRPVNEVLRMIDDEKRIQIDAAMLLKLVEQKILIPADENK